MSAQQTSSAPHKHPLSPEWIHAITILLGHPLTSKVGQNIQKWIIYKANFNYIKFAFEWDPIQFEDNKHLQKYEETNGSISYLKSNTVKQHVSLKIYMFLLICQDTPAGQNYNRIHFIKGDQSFKLTTIDLKTALINEMFENPGYKTPFRGLMYKITPPSSSVRSPILMKPNPFKKGTKPDDPPQNVNKPHLSASISTITNLDVTSTLDTSCDQLLHFDPHSYSSDPQDTSSDENVEIEFLPEFEVQLDYANLSPTDVFLRHHDDDLFLLNQEIYTLSDNLNFQNTHVCDNADVSLIHATNLSHTFTLPQFMAQHNYEGLSPNDNPSEVPTTINASNDHPFNPWCAHNLMATQCNQSQYHNPNHNFTLPELMA